MNTLLRRRGGPRGGGSPVRSLPAGVAAVALVLLLAAVWSSSASDAAPGTKEPDNAPYVPPPTAPRGRRYRRGGSPTPAPAPLSGESGQSTGTGRQRSSEEELEEHADAQVSFEEEALARAPPEPRAWCAWNNRHNLDPALHSPVSAGTDDTVCFGKGWTSGKAAAAEMLRLVVTARASDLMANASSSVEWLKNVPFPVTLYVKADLEGVEEDGAGGGAAADDEAGAGGAGGGAAAASPAAAADDIVARELGIAYRRLPGFRERLEQLPPFPAVADASVASGMSVAGMASALQRHYAVAWGAVGVDYGSATSAARRKSQLRTAGTAVQRFLRRLKVWRAEMAENDAAGSHADAEVTVHVQPNVGDEAAAITSYIASATAGGPALNASADQHTYHLETADTRRRHGLAGAPPPPKFTAFVHSHLDSWHSIDVVEQLKCMCLSPSTRRYVTLTAPSRAFMFQCAPLRPTTATATAAAAERLSASPAAQEAAAMARRTELIADATMQNHADAFSLLVGGADVPEVIARDCCASFVISEVALRAAAGKSDFNRMQRMLLAQPLSHSAAAALREANAVDAADPDAAFAEVNQARDNDSAETGGGSSPSAPRVWEELSMYAERVWRHVFRPSLNDIARDLSAVGCGTRTSSLKRAKLQRLVKECSIAGGRKSRGRGDREVGGIEGCPAGAEKNRYQLE